MQLKIEFEEHIKRSFFNRLANPGTLFYLALDDFDAGLKALPFFAKQVKSDDPSGYKIIGMSKPLPAVAVSKTVDRKYLA